MINLTVKFSQLIVTFYCLLVHPMYVDNHNLYLCDYKSIMSLLQCFATEQMYVFVHVPRQTCLGYITMQEMLCMLLNVAISETVM